MVTIRQNLKLLGGGVPPVIRVTQGDTAVTLLLTLYSGNSPFAKPSGAEALIECTKPDSKAIKTDAVYNADGTVSVTLTEQMTCVTGEAYCKVGIREVDGKVSTAAFILNVEPSGVTDGAVISESDVPDIRKIIDAADNAKRYTAQAVESAANAKTSESNAKTSETNASKSASSAATSASKAKTSETNAASSKTAAATSASNAKTSASNAKTSETNASKSASSASSNANAAKTAAANAKSSEANAKSSADAAAESAKAAAGAVTGVIALNGLQGDLAIAFDEDKGDIAIDGDLATSKVYGFRIDGDESDPSAAVVYLRDAVGMTPAKMDYTNDRFDYGSWEDAFFMPRPCMLKQNGVVAYYLDPNDFTKKVDGTASDIADTSFAGNAMMEWGRDGKKIWLKVTPRGEASADVYIASYQVDSSYRAWSFMDANGAYVDHFYTPIYNGSVVDGVMRSISGQSVSGSLTAAQEIADAKANGAGWMTEAFGDRLLINYLLVLIGKSLDTQVVFGRGITLGGESEFNAYKTGTLNGKGLFYGSSGTTAAVKVFGMENLWGLQWRRTAGLVVYDGTMRYKLTESSEDGASGGYTLTGADYIDSGVATSGSNASYIKSMAFAKDGAMLPKTLDSSSSTYYADAGWFNFSANTYTLLGGSLGSGAKCGAFCFGLGQTTSSVQWNRGAAVSYKPLA